MPSNIFGISSNPISTALQCGDQKFTSPNRFNHSTTDHRAKATVLIRLAPAHCTTLLQELCR